MGVSSREVAIYLREFAAEMEQIAAAHQLDTLAFIFGMAEQAAMEAISESKEEDVE